MQRQLSIGLNLTYLDAVSWVFRIRWKTNVYRRYDLSMHVFISSAGPSGSRTLMHMSDICGSRKPVFGVYLHVDDDFLCLFADNVCLCVRMLVV